MQVKTMIIGTGPYGISIANVLHYNKSSFAIAGKPFELWYHHTLDSMAIRSDWHTSEIFSPNNAYDFRKFLYNTYPNKATEILKDRIPIDIFRNYLQFVERSLPYNIDTEYVKLLEKVGNHYHTTLANGRVIESEKVVIATGIGGHKYLPKSLNQFSTTEVIHAWQKDKIQNISEKRVLVVGAGQSAAESIVHIKKNNSISWCLKKDPIFYSEPLNLPVPIFKFILKISPYFYFLPKTLKYRFGKKYVIATITPDMQNDLTQTNVEILKTDVDTLQLTKKNNKIYSNTLNKEFDIIIAATGYKFSLQNMNFIAESLREQIKTENQLPQLNFSFETNINGLYFAGGMAEPTCGPAQRFIMGATHAATKIGKVCSQ